MNRKLLVTQAALIILLSAGCVSRSRLSVSESSPIRPRYSQGVATLLSEKKNSVVVRLLSPEFTIETHSLPSFYVGMVNGMDVAVDFSTENIKAFSGEKSVRVYTYDEIEKRIKREAAWTAFAVALNGASQSMAASMPQTTQTTGSVTSSGPGGYSTGTYTGTTTTYNPAATASANARIQANTRDQLESIASSASAQVNNAQAMLRRNTVGIYESTGGIVKLHAEDIKRGRPLRIIVQVGEESHEFLFTVEK